MNKHSCVCMCILRYCLSLWVYVFLHSHKKGGGGGNSWEQISLFACLKHTNSSTTFCEQIKDFYLCQPQPKTHNVA